MLRYIHQFVQTFLKEASKTRPKSRKSSRSSVEFPNEKSTLKPEILALDVNNEGPDAEHKKEILQLKRTYSLLMRKFVNPNLDLMTDNKMPKEINIFNLKEKQELIKAMLNKIFYESVLQKKIENSSKSKTRKNVKVIEEEPSVGWTGQKTTKLAATPMVETASKPKNIATALYTFPEAADEEARRKRIEEFHKRRSRLLTLKRTEIHKPKSENGSDFTKYEPSTIKKLDYGKESVMTIKKAKTKTTKTKTDYEEGKEFLRITGMSVLSKENSDESSQPLLDIEQNHSQVTNRESKPNLNENYLTQYNKKKNIKIIRSITQEDKNKIAEPDVESLKDENTITTKHERRYQNAAAEQINNKKEVDENIIKSVKNDNFGDVELTNNRLSYDKNSQSERDPVNNEDSLSESMQKYSKPSPDRRSMNSENIDLSLVESYLNEIYSNEGKTGKQEKLFEQNTKNMMEDQFQGSDEQDNLKRIDQAGANNNKLTFEGENSKSNEYSYWNILSNKLLQTGNDAQKFINLELNNWKTKAINATQEIAKDYIPHGQSNNQNSVESPNEKIEENIQTHPANNDIKADSQATLEQNEMEQIKSEPLLSPRPKQKESENKISTKPKEKNDTKGKYSKTPTPKRTKSGSQDGLQVKDNDLDKVTLNPTEGSPILDEISNKVKVLPKECNDQRLPKVASAKSSPRASRPSSRKSSMNITQNKDKSLKNDSKITVDVQKAKIITNKASEVPKSPENKSLKKTISRDSIKPVFPENDSKMKKLLKYFKKTHNQKLNQRVRSVPRKYGKTLNEGKTKKLSLTKLKINKKNPIPYKEKKVSRSKSIEDTIDKDLPSNNPTAEEMSSILTNPPNTNIQREEKSKNVSDKNKLKANRSKTYIEKSSRSKSGSRSKSKTDIGKSSRSKSGSRSKSKTDIRKSSRSKSGGRSKSKSKINLEIDHKARKLHTKKEFYKPTMKKLKMYGTRRYIYTLSNIGTKTSENVRRSCSGNITEPNLASGSLLSVCELTTNKPTTRNMHSGTRTTEVKEKVLPRNKTNNSTNKSDKLSPDRSLPNMNSILRKKTNDAVEPFKKSGKTTSTPISSGKENNTTGTTPTQIEVKRFEDGSCVSSKGIQSFKENELLESPKWKSKEERLEKMKSQAKTIHPKESENESVKKSNVVIKNNSCSAKKEAINTEKHIDILEKNEKKKDHSGKIPPTSKIQTRFNILNNTNYGKTEKPINTEHSLKMINKEPVRLFSSITSKNQLTQKTNIRPEFVKIEPTVDESTKKDISSSKIKEFESKLRDLETKLKNLESKTSQENNVALLMKTKSDKRIDEINLRHNTYNAVNSEKKSEFKEEVNNLKQGETRSGSPNKHKLTTNFENDTRDFKRDLNEIMKQNLSHKVKTLELKLKNLEDKVNDMKEKPVKSAKSDNNYSKKKSSNWSLVREKGSNLSIELRNLGEKVNDMKEKRIKSAKSENNYSKKKSSNWSSENEKVSKLSVPILQAKKLDKERKSLVNESSIQSGNLNSFLKNQNRESKTGTIVKIISNIPPELLPKHQPMMNKNNSKKEIQSSKAKNVYNYMWYAENGKLNLKNSEVESVSNIPKSEKKPKAYSPSKISEKNRGLVMSIVNKGGRKKVKITPGKAGFVPITNVTYSKESKNKENKGDILTNITRKKLRKRLTPDLERNTFRVRKAKKISKSVVPSSTSLIQKDSRKGGFKISPLKSNTNVNVKIKTEPISKKKIPKTPIIAYKASKKTLKKNSLNRLEKGQSRSRFQNEEKQKPLFEGLLKGKNFLKLLESREGECHACQEAARKINKIHNEISNSTAKSSDSILFPKNISKALEQMIVHRQINDITKNKNLDLNVSRKSENSNTRLNSTRSEIANTIQFNSFDYYKPKRRSTEVKHPIELELQGVNVFNKTENLLDTLHSKHFPQYLGVLSDRGLKLNTEETKSEKSGRGSSGLLRECSKHLYVLASQKDSTTTKSIHK